MSGGPIIGGLIAGLAGRAIDSLADTVPRIVSATVVGTGVGTETVVELDTAIGVSVTARSLTGWWTPGARVYCLAYPPRGLLVLGAIAAQGSPALIVLTSGTSLTAATLPAGARFLQVEAVGGGGAGGGAPLTAAGESSGGGHGQSGHYARSVLALSELTFPVPYAIGAGGTGVAGAGGGTGGTTTFSTGTSLVSAGGGSGGSSMAAGTVTAFAAGGAGVLAATGQLTITGSHGACGFRTSATVVVLIGNAGSGPLGASRRGGAAANVVGSAGLPYGGGGAASSAGPSVAVDRAGGDGADGAIVLTPRF